MQKTKPETVNSIASLAVTVTDHQVRLDVVIVSAVDELTGDGHPGVAGVRVHVTTPWELELGLVPDHVIVPLHLVAAGLVDLL